MRRDLTARRRPPFSRYAVNKVERNKWNEKQVSRGRSGTPRDAKSAMGREEGVLIVEKLWYIVHSRGTVAGSVEV